MPLNSLDSSTINKYRVERIRMSFIYVLKCPKDGQIRYIGKAKDPQRRLYTHLLDARKPRTNSKKVAWLRALLASGLKPECIALMPVGGEFRWQTAERFFIVSGRYFGFQLLNATDGGEGIADTKEVAAKISASRRAAWATKDGRDKYLSACHSTEARASRKTACIASKANEESRAAASLHSKSLWAKPEYKAIKSAATAAAWADETRRPARKKAVSDGQRMAWSDPEKKAKRVSLFVTPEFREKMREVNRQNWARRKAADAL